MTNFPWPPTLPPLPLTHFYWIPTLPPLSLTYFNHPPPLTPLPLKALSWSLPEFLNLYVLDFLAFALMISGIETAQNCLPFYFSSLAVMFLEHLIWRE